jgi:dihydroorotate dehydrogenase subfamily 1
MSAANLSIEVNGMLFDNPFVLASGPPGTNGKVIAKSFNLGWGGIVIKTISLDADKVINTNPRYGKLRTSSGDVIGFENIELISDRPFEVWLDELVELKKQFPKKMLIASVMEEYDKERWQEIITRVQKTGVDGFELNLSCPHGLPERKMGMAMGSNPEIVNEVCGWVMEVAELPVWAKMTPNVGIVTAPAEAALNAGVDGISLINTILSVLEVDLKTLRPTPTVQGYTVPGGYSGQAVRPIALRQVMEVARQFPNVSISGMGGVNTGTDAAQFILLGSSTVQVCTGAMLQGYGVISKLKEEMAGFMNQHGFKRISDFVGHSLPYFSTHADLVKRQKEAKAAKAGRTNRDEETWQGNIAEETDSLTSN